MRLFTRIAKAALVLTLAGVGSGANAAITVSEPQATGDDSFTVLVNLTAPLGFSLDALELRVDFDAPLNLTQVVKQAGVPGNYETLQPKFGSISYLSPATLPVGPLFQLSFDVTAPITTSALIEVKLRAFPTLTDDEELPGVDLLGVKEITPIPEPTTYALVGAGLLLVAWTRRRRFMARS